LPPGIPARRMPGPSEPELFTPEVTKGLLSCSITSVSVPAQRPCEFVPDGRDDFSTVVVSKQT